MSNKKDMFDLFRESEQQLTERPSSKAWQRLEARLDENKKKQNEQKKSVLYRRLLAVAAVAILLVTAGLAVLLQQKSNPNLTASAEMPSILEDLSFYKNNDNEPLKVVEFTRKHVSQLANPIEEGSLDKKLRPNIK